MTVITFRPAQHSVFSVGIVEVLLDGNVIAVIYPSDKGIRIVSAHFESSRGDELTPTVEVNNGKADFPPIPSIAVQFDPQPYHITQGKLVRVGKKSHLAKKVYWISTTTYRCGFCYY